MEVTLYLFGILAVATAILLARWQHFTIQTRISATMMNSFPFTNEATIYSTHCPLNERNPTYFPHETNCSLFYECSNGRPVLLPCPRGLDFDVARKVCDDPELANCQIHFSTAAA